MKRLFYAIPLFAALFFVACESSDNEPLYRAATTLNYTDEVTDGILGTTPKKQGSAQGYYFGNIYEPGTTVTTGTFTFNHVGYTSEYEGNTYEGWYGIVPSTVNDPSDHGSNFYLNSWGNRASTGNSAVAPPFMVAYWSEYNDANFLPAGRAFSESGYSCWVKVTPPSGRGTAYASTINISYSPYSYYSALNGDGWARPLNQEGDYFNLYILGVKGTTFKTSYVTQQLLVNKKPFTGSIDIPVTSLGDVDYLVFQMASSDTYYEELYGRDFTNTPTYFCINDITVELR